MARSPFDVSDILLQGGNMGQLLGRGIEQAASGLAGGIERYAQIKDRNKQLQGTVDSTTKFLEAASKMQGLPEGLKSFATQLGSQLHDPSLPLAQKAAMAQQAGQNIGQYIQLGQAATQEQQRLREAKTMQNLAMMQQFGGTGGAGVLNPQAMAQVKAMQANPMMQMQSQIMGATGQLAAPKDLMDYAQAQATMKKPQGQFMTAAEFNAYKEQNKGMDIKAVPVDGGVMVTGLGTYAPSNPTVIKTGDDQVAKQLFSSMTDMQAKAQQAANTLSSISVAKDIINNKDFVSGAMAEPKLYAYKLAKAMGYQGDEAQNTEVLRAQIAVPVFQILKSLGSGAGVSDKDLEFAQKVVGGQISLEPESIKRLLEIGEKASRKIVNSYNQRLDKTYPKGNKDYEQARNFLELTSAETELPAVGQITPSPANNPVALPDGWSIRSR